MTELREFHIEQAAIEWLKQIGAALKAAWASPALALRARCKSESTKLSSVALLSVSVGSIKSAP